MKVFRIASVSFPSKRSIGESHTTFSLGEQTSIFDLLASQKKANIRPGRKIDGEARTGQWIMVDHIVNGGVKSSKGFIVAETEGEAKDHIVRMNFAAMAGEYGYLCKSTSDMEAIHEWNRQINYDPRHRLYVTTMGELENRKMVAMFQYTKDRPTGVLKRRPLRIQHLR